MALDGVERATVHFNTGRIEVDYDPEAVESDGLVAAVRSVGYEAKVAPF
jgi:copper chaperone CopZ